VSRELDGFERFCSKLILDENGTRSGWSRSSARCSRDYFGGVRRDARAAPEEERQDDAARRARALHLLLTDNAECVIGAASRDQATILYDQAGGFRDALAGS
jgi:hypothetical protein